MQVAVFASRVEKVFHLLPLLIFGGECDCSENATRVYPGGTGVSEWRKLANAVWKNTYNDSVKLGMCLHVHVV
jgi:hypothetical protein